MSTSTETMEMPTATACVLCDHTPCVLGGADKTMWLCVPCDADVNDRLRLRETKTTIESFVNDDVKAYLDSLTPAKSGPEQESDSDEEEEECPGCLRPKTDEEYREVRCCRCDEEMCDQCYSVSPIEGDDDCYCKRCGPEECDSDEEEKQADRDWEEMTPAEYSAKWTAERVRAMKQRLWEAWMKAEETTQ